MRNRSLVSTLTTLALIASCAAWGGHRDTPRSVGDPASDVLDVFSWVQGTNLVVVADFIGLEEPEAGPNWPRFDENALYEIHLARGGTSLADALTYQFQFTTAAPVRADPNANPPLQVPFTHGIDVMGPLAQGGAFQQTYTVTQVINNGGTTVQAQNVPVPPPNVGSETNTAVYAIPSGMTYENTWGDLGNAKGTTAMLLNGGVVFAGPRDDPSFEDDGAINDLLQFRPINNPTSTNVRRVSYAYTNVHAIVLQIPLIVANGGVAVTAGAGNAAQTVGVWASVSRRAATVHRRDGTELELGPWRQVSRAGLPYFARFFIGLQDRDSWNHSTPASDLSTIAPYILNPVMVRDGAAVGFYGPAGPFNFCAPGGMAPETNRVDIPSVYNLGNASITSIGDVLRVDLGAATSSFPNGRLLSDRVVDLTAGLILCGAANIVTFYNQNAVGPFTSEATLPKGGAMPQFPYLLPPWEGRSASPRAAPAP